MIECGLYIMDVSVINIIIKGFEYGNTHTRFFFRGSNIILNGALCVQPSNISS